MGHHQQGDFMDMGVIWLSGLVLWAVVELVGYISKTPFKKRMRRGAISGAILMTLATIGATNTSGSFLTVLLMALLINGTVVGLVYWLRISLDWAWNRWGPKKPEPLIVVPD
jgi:uncharacterized membrane protein YjjP (DUF1212 family)